MKRFGKEAVAARRRRQFSRRDFLAGGTAAGLTLGLSPWLLAACGDGGSSKRATPTPTSTPTPIPTEPRPREDCTLQFDNSFGDLEDLRIEVFGSEDEGVPLQMHDEESRDHFRDENPMLADVPDASLTHFIEDVDLPADALQLFWVTGKTRDGEDALASLNIHVPQPVLVNLAQSAAARGQRLTRSAKMQHYGIAAQTDERDLAEVFPAVATFVTPFDTATALVFQQPDLLNINVTAGASILDLIQRLPCAVGSEDCDPYIATLAFRIATAWPATESGFTTFNRQRVEAWAKLVQVVGVDGNPVLDSQGEPAMTYDVNDEIARTAISVAHNLRKMILNSAEFEGFTWHPTEGMTTETEGASRSRVFFSDAAGVAPKPVEIVGERAQGTTAHGVEFTKIAIVNQSKRTVEVEIRNHYIRFVSAFVRYANEAGDLPLTPGSDDTSRSQFLRLLNPNYTVLGIPLLGDSVEKQTFQFDIPENATKARLYFGSLGVGGEAFSPEAVSASVATLGFNIGLPVLLLAAGATAGAALQGQITGFLQSPPGRTALGLIVVRAIALAGPQVATGIYGTKNSGNATPVLASLGNALLTIILSAPEFSALAINIGVVFIVNRAGDFALPLSWAFKAAALAADVATLAQTVVEVLSSPAIFTNTLSLQMQTKVTISKDPDNFTFPARARSYRVTLIYDQASKVAHQASGSIESGREAPIEVVFEKVPSGGNVSVEVVILAEDGQTIVGGSANANGELAPVGPIANTPAAAGAIAIPIKEQLIPLTGSTRYAHSRKLAYQEGAHVWTDTSSAPTATRAELCQGQDNRLCDLVAITISQRTGMLGYAFQAGGQNVAYCGEATGGTMYAVQNISVASGRDRALKQLPCGFRTPAGVLYDRLGPADGSGHNFFVQPTGSGYYLQSITLDATTPINVNNPLSWGRFSQAMDSLALHPMGFVVGVNRTSHKMEILELPSTPVNGSAAPDAIPFAVQKCGEGDRLGLLRVPVAVTVSGGAILVLEIGNNRVQAFDVTANPAPIFDGKAFFDLASNPGGTYLDIGVDGLGYVYVLSHATGGSRADDYRLDVYAPNGAFLNRTSGVAAGRMAVDTFRSVYTLNYETLTGAPRIEPSVSHWVPVTPQ